MIYEVITIFSFLGILKISESPKSFVITSYSIHYTKLYESVGKEIGLKHIYSENVHYGILKEVYSDNIVLKQNEKEVTLNISNVSLMENKELEDFV